MAVVKNKKLFQKTIEDSKEEIVEALMKCFEAEIQTEVQTEITNADVQVILKFLEDISLIKAFVVEPEKEEPKEEPKEEQKKEILEPKKRGRKPSKGK